MEQSALGATHAGEETQPTTADPRIRRQILAILETRDDKPKLPPSRKRRQAGRVLLTWLRHNGQFVQAQSGDVYYFYRPKRKLYALDSEQWITFLHYVTDVNPAGPDFKYLAADCRTEARKYGEKKEVVRVSAWDDKEKVLRVSRFDGTVYRLDGESVNLEHNGEHVLFADHPLWEPYDPDFGSSPGAVLNWSTADVPPWEGDSERYALAYRAWILATFFSELCPTKPLLLLAGEKGSGKSMALRIFLRLLFGPSAELSGVPAKPDDLRAAASNAHVLVMDNLDSFTPTLRDTLARISTGAVDEFRVLYTSNEVGRAVYRTWIAITSRTPDTLKRDDLADRTLILRTSYIPDHERQPEREFLAQAAKNRDVWWGNALQRLNAMVALIRREGMSPRSNLRMADWESLGRVVAQIEGKESLWDDMVAELKRGQSGFLLEGELIVDALELWLENVQNHGREMTTRELYDELTQSIYPDRRPPADWPKSVQGFGKRLANIRRELRALYGVRWADRRARQKIYQFWPGAEHGGQSEQLGHLQVNEPVRVLMNV